MKKLLIVVWLILFLVASGYTVYLLHDSRGEINEITLPVPEEKNKKKAAAEVAKALPIASFFVDKESARNRAILYEYLAVVIGLSGVLWGVNILFQKRKHSSA